MSTYQQGQKGEDLAAAYLLLKGYKVLERNYRVPQGEIDLILLKGDTLVFVEVKTRRSGGKGTPQEAVSPRKVKRLSAAAAVYLSRQTRSNVLCRFDVVAIGPDRNWLGLPKVRHLKDAFSAEGSFNV